MILRDLFKIGLSDTIINSYWVDRFKRGYKYPVVGIDLIFGNGKRIRISTRSITLLDNATNESIHYQPLLMEDLEISESYNWDGGSPSQRTFTITMDSRAIDPLNIILNGDILAGTAEISLIDDEIPYEKRFVFMIGDMIGGVTFGANEEVLEVDISDPKLTIDKIVPEFMTSFNTFDENYLPDNQLGFRYPLIFNKWNKVPCILVYYNAFTPAFLVSLNHNVSVTKVYRNGELKLSNETVLNSNNIPNNQLYQWNTENLNDLEGTPYKQISFLNSDLMVYNENTWERSDTVYADVETTDTYTVIDLVRILLRDYTGFREKGLDEILFSKAKNKEPNYLTAGICINGSNENSITTLDYITNTLLSSFPMIQLAYSAQGIGVVFTDRKQQYTNLHLIRGQNLLYDRVSALQESSKEDLYNVFTIQYDYNAMEDNYNKMIQISSKNNNLCEISEQKIGRREMDTVQAINVFDDLTAEYIANWYANHHTLPSYTVEYVGDPRLYFLLKIGDNIELTDDKLGLQNAKGTITDISYRRGEVTIGFRLWLLYDKISSSLII